MKKYTNEMSNVETYNPRLLTQSICDQLISELGIKCLNKIPFKFQSKKNIDKYLSDNNINLSRLKGIDLNKVDDATLDKCFNLSIDTYQLIPSRIKNIKYRTAIERFEIFHEFLMCEPIKLNDNFEKMCIDPKFRMYFRFYNRID